ncbi:MAG: diaminopimelate epimerase [Micavibrio sp.]|nr:diaminopimelate epimerase [Micavibrio sp.]
MEKIQFIKMHGLGNDFVIIDARIRDFGNLAELSLKLADRRFGVGCDQVIFMEASDKADVKLSMFNADGSVLRMCGNAMRCIADIIFREKNIAEVRIETISRFVSCTQAENGMITVDMGKPVFPPQPQSSPLKGEDCTLVDMGNPHCVFFVNNVEQYPVEEVGSQVEHHKMFPDRTNVEFVEVKDRHTLRMRVWERGTGMTLACGSGACATAVAAIYRDYTESKVTIEMDGGNLQIEWRDSDSHICMTGPVSYVFKGEMEQ